MTTWNGGGGTYRGDHGDRAGTSPARQESNRVDFHWSLPSVACSSSLFQKAQIQDWRTVLLFIVVHSPSSPTIFKEANPGLAQG